MKKISVLMAALTAVTVGGVYAAWTYAESNLTNISSKEQVINVAGIDNSTALKAGSFNIEASKDLNFVIDSAAAVGLTGKDRYTTPTKLDDGSYADYYVVGTSLAGYSVAGRYHQHEAVLLVKGEITVSFIPAQQASQDIQDKGIATNVYFTNPSAITIENITWEDQGQILKFNNLAHKLREEKDSDDGEWTQTKENDQTVFTYKYTYTTAELAKMLTLKQNIVLDTSAKHYTFSDKLDGLTVKLHVEQATPTTEN
jgi:hypothetical protein